MMAVTRAMIAAARRGCEAPRTVTQISAGGALGDAAAAIALKTRWAHVSQASRVSRATAAKTACTRPGRAHNDTPRSASRPVRRDKPRHHDQCRACTGPVAYADGDRTGARLGNTSEPASRNSAPVAAVASTPRAGQDAGATPSTADAAPVHHAATSTPNRSARNRGVGRRSWVDIDSPNKYDSLDRDSRCLAIRVAQL